MTVEILIGDCRARLAELPDQSVHTCVTSPPYFGLRDYGCAGQIGLEPTPAEFLVAMVEVFREVRRVLRDDGTVWINIGDSYAGGGKGGNPGHSPHIKQKSNSGSLSVRAVKREAENMKPKNLMGIPWRLAFALQDDGWYLRQDIIWSKPNPMPESVLDRCTKSHEYIFLLTKQDRYHFDQDAIREAANLTGKGNANSFRGGSYVNGATFDNAEGGNRKVSGNRQPVPGGWDTGKGTHGSFHRDGSRRGSRDSFKREGSKRGVAHVGQNVGTHRPDRDDGQWDVSKRNKRSVWNVATVPFKDAHFATYPPALIEPCILAGCPEGGTVLDPFGGAGTTGLVADRLKRNAILIELNPEYAEIARKRIEGDARLFSNVTVSDPLAGAAMMMKRMR